MNVIVSSDSATGQTDHSKKRPREGKRGQAKLGEALQSSRDLSGLILDSRLTIVWKYSSMKHVVVASKRTETIGGNCTRQAGEKKQRKKKIMLLQMTVDESIGEEWI